MSLVRSAAIALFAIVSHAHPSTLTVLYKFADKADGGNPIGGVIQDDSGTIYGETYRGGTLPCTTDMHSNAGCGTVYSISSSGVFRVLVSFTGANGAHGNVSMVRVENTLYGATEHGGANNDGVVFSVNTDGTGYTLLHQFNGADGSNPIALVAGADGTIYGAAKFGGLRDAGVLFSIAPGGGYTVLHYFFLPTSSVPSTLIMAPDGSLVGGSLLGGAPSSACHQGCGTVFQYNITDESFSTLYTLFSSDKQSSLPYVGSFGPGPTLYVSNYALIFSLSQAAGFSKIADYNNYTVGAGSDSGPLYTPDGSLYGTIVGGPVSLYGGIYTVKNNVISDAYVFGTVDGDTPIAKPTLTADGSLIGTNSRDGHCGYCGSVWRYTP